MVESGFSLVLQVAADAALVVRLTVPSDLVVLLATTLALVLPLRVAVLLTDGVTEDDTLREDGVVVLVVTDKRKGKRASNKK